MSTALRSRPVMLRFPREMSTRLLAVDCFSCIVPWSLSVSLSLYLSFLPLWFWGFRFFTMEFATRMIDSACCKSGHSRFFFSFFFFLSSPFCTLFLSFVGHNIWCIFGGVFDRGKWYQGETRLCIFIANLYIRVCVVKRERWDTGNRSSMEKPVSRHVDSDATNSFSSSL